jgi:hypothetical protein
MEEMRNEHNILVRDSEEPSPLDKFKRRRRDDKVGFKGEKVYGDLNEICVVWDAARRSVMCFRVS